MNANYSFVSCSHFLIIKTWLRHSKRCANFQTHKLLKEKRIFHRERLSRSHFVKRKSFLSSKWFARRSDAKSCRSFHSLIRYNLFKLLFWIVCFTSFSYYMHYFARRQTSLVLFESLYSIGARVYETLPKILLSIL